MTYTNMGKRAFHRDRVQSMEKIWFVLLVAFACWVAATCRKPCPGCKCMKWTKWINADDPSGVGDFETLHYDAFITDGNGTAGSVARKLWTDYNITCNHPIEIECRDTVTRQPFFKTGDVTVFPASVRCTTDQGFACANAYQEDGKCRDYEVRLLCWTPCRKLQWMPWSNHDDPGGKGDYEMRYLADHPARTYEPCPTGSSPYDIECRRADLGTNALLAGQKKIVCDRNKGLVCLNSENQDGCYDYEVRYLCRV